MLKRAVVNLAAPVLDLALAPLVIASSLLMRLIRRLGIWRMPVSKAIFNLVGIYPVRDHYYEPMFNFRAHLKHSLRKERNLPGININEAGQLDWLSRFKYADELSQFPMNSDGESCFYYDNPNFSRGDAECLYSLIRLCKPKRIIEIGSGFSTMMAREAIAQNQREDALYQCRHICIEPYEMAWLDSVTDVEVIRHKVEEMSSDLFLDLAENDILFIDSSHVIRPQGDVLCEYLTILPILQPGVLVHIHDIFTPRDYLDEWLLNEAKLWNEQYLLEAFLSCNSQFEIIIALNFLIHSYPDELSAKFPTLQESVEEIEPGSLWIRKLG